MMLQSVSCVVTYFLPSCSLLMPTAGYIALSRGVGDCPVWGGVATKAKVSSCACSNGSTKCLSWCRGSAVRSQPLCPEITLLTPVTWPVGLIWRLLTPVGSNQGIWNGGPVCPPGRAVMWESAAPPELFPPEPGAELELLHKPGHAVGFKWPLLGRSFSSPVGWAWQTCSAC